MGGINVNILKSVLIINDPVREYLGLRSYLDTGNLKNGQIKEINEYSYSEKPSRANQNVHMGDIILARMKETVKVKVISKSEENLMVSTGYIILRPKLDTADTRYLYHVFNSDKFQRNKNILCTGATQKAINNGNFKRLKIPLPPLPTQKKIAAILDEADRLRNLNKNLIKKYDELSQSLFLEMFGDPVRNEMGWEKVPLKNFGKIVTGNTPSRRNEANYSSEFIEWVKTNNIPSDRTYVSKAKEYLSKEGLRNGRSVTEGSLLVACIAGSIKSIGRAALTDRRVALNQQINAIEPSKDTSSLFLFHLFRLNMVYIQDHASHGMKRMLSKGVFQEIQMIKPPIELQNQFAERIQAIEAQKAQAEVALQKSEDLFNSLLQKAFKGELV